jgi:carboxymethylenebutenolidase
MGRDVEFASNGSTAQGYLAEPASGSGPGVLVIQEWWGLVPHIRDVCDRFAAEGFVALSPDLYHGASTTEPDEAGKLMMGLSIDRAAQDMSGAVDHLLGLDSTGDGVGVVGFCMGGGLALVVSCNRGDAVKAVAPFYGLIPWESAQPDWSQLRARVRGHYAEADEYFPPTAARGLEAELRGHGLDAELSVHPGAQHAFFNDTRPEVYDAGASATAWAATLELFRTTL